MRSLIIDNYDSYTYSLFQLIGKVSGIEPLIIKNDELSYNEILSLDFDNVIISSGIGHPKSKKNFGVCKEIIQKLEKPILGISLGHQGIYHYNGGQLLEIKNPMYASTSKVYHKGEGLFKNIKNGFKVARYHALICENKELENISIDAKTDDNIVMAISHKYKPIYGVQFHPQSIASEYGEKIIKNFFLLCEDFYRKKTLYFEKIDSYYNTKDIFEKLYTFDKKVIWLDSSKVEKGLSRFSIFGLSSEKRGAVLKYTVKTKTIEKIFLNGSKSQIYNEDIFGYLKKHREKWIYNEELPFDFQLGYIGYLGYELKKDTENTNNKYKYEYPDAYFRYCDRAIVYDHLEEKLYILSYFDDKKWVSDLKNFLMTNLPEKTNYHSRNIPKIKFIKDKASYIKDITKIKKLIKKGAVYQVCLTNRLDIFDNIDAKEYYMHLRKASPGQYSAFLPFENIQIASSSMECFIKVDKHKTVISKPIKGTIKRGNSETEDFNLISQLKNDTKTQAENLIIVDVLLNDLGKVCEIGSLNVPKLMDVETYKTLHQLVTTVSGKVKNNVDVVEVLEKAFPGGSMTGAPKKHALEILDTLETVPRGVYSGAIGFISNNSTIDFNVVIRTAIIEKEKMSIGVGGAIVELSDAEEEFEEIVLKAKGVLTALKSYYGTENIVIEGE